MANALNVAANTGSFAATGLAVGGPIGAAIGAAVGFFGSIFGGHHVSQGPILRATADQVSQELIAYAQQEQTQARNESVVLAGAISVLIAAIAVRKLHEHR